MDTYAISEDSVALLLPGDVVLLLRMAGFEPWARVEAELFSLNGASLLLARPAPPRTRRLRGHEPRLNRRS